MTIAPLTQPQVDALAATVGHLTAGLVRLADVDLTRGMGILGEFDRCCWTHDAHRITIAISPDWLYAGIGKQPDEEAPPHVG